MAQHDYNIANQTGANFRADLNNALSAIATNNSGDNEPSTTFAYEWWIDTTNDVLKLRNSANNAWITMPFSITADNTIDINAGTVNGITSFSFSSGATVTSILDEDNLSSDSATALATQQSIKAYVDSQVTAQDLDISDGSSTISIDLDSETLSLLGGTGVTSAASGNGVTFSIGQSVGTSDNVVFNQVTGALVGNASTATALATARTIGGTSFDGTANIAVNLSATATALATPRTISGVSFDGTANITLDTDDIGEGSSNLYYTDARVQAISINNVVEDTTPQLGGNLDVNGQDIVSVSNGNITLTPDGTGVVRIDGSTGVDIQQGSIKIKNGGTQSYIDFYCEVSNAHYLRLQAPAHSAFSGNPTVTLPNTAGTIALTSSNITGNSATASSLETARAIALAGDVVGTANFDGSAGISITTAIQPNSVALATDTTGNYVAGISGTTNEIEVSGSGSENATVTIGLPDDVTVSNDLIVSGNLTVTGSTTQTGSVITDSNFQGFTDNNTGNLTDFGFYGKYVESTTTKYAGLFYDASTDNTFRLFTDTQTKPSTTVNTGATGYTVAGLVANLTGNVTGNVTGNITGDLTGNVTGDLTGNADTATALANGRTIALSGDVTASGVSFDGTGNITLSTTIASNSVALGSDTTGNYVSTIAGTTNEIEVSGSGSETATVTIGLPNDVTIAGNLTVNGTTTTVNSDTLAVTDPLIKLAKSNSGADSLDIGFYGLYDTSGSQDLYAGLFRDANDSGKFKLFKDLQVEPTTTVNTSGTGYAVGTLVSNLEGNVTGNVTGQVSTLSNHDTDNLSEGSSNLYFTNARADTRINLQTGANLDLSSKSTSNLSEGTNLYYTDARFDTRLGTKTTDNLTEGSSNLYMTTERVQDIVGGMVSGNTETGITVTYDDSDGTLDFVVGTLNQDTTGNAATATALETARTIGGVSFDGTGNIDLAGVNTAGNQNTSGNAATATALATARTIGGVSFDGTANIDLAGVNSTGNQDTSGNAATATTLATARTIGGTSFDGSANIAVALASTATTLATARTINGVSFDGSANITTLTAGTGVSVSGTAVSIGQAVETSDSPTFTNLTLNGTDSIKVPAGTTAQRNGSPAAGMLRYNSTTGEFEGYTNAWGAIGGGSGSFSTNIFSGDGSDTTFTLSAAPSNENNLLVFVDGVFQAHNVYSVSGTTLTFATAPANGRVITVYNAEEVSIGTPSDNSVSTVKLQDDSVTSAKLDTNIDIAGTLGVTGEVTLATHLNMGDSDKLKIGTGGDLEIYHDGSNSYIDEAGTGHLFIRSNGDGIYLRSSTDEEIAHFNVNGSVKSYYDNALRLETTSTGITVIGAVETNGARILVQRADDDSSVAFANNSSGTPSSHVWAAGLDYSNSNAFSIAYANNGFPSLSASSKLVIDTSGNVGIGSTTAYSNYNTLTIGQGGVGSILQLDGSTSGHYHLVQNNNGAMIISADQGNAVGSTTMNFLTDGTERMRIDNSGNLLVGKTSPSLEADGHWFRANGESFHTIVNTDNTLHIYDTTNNTYRFYVSGGGTISATSTSITGLSDERLKENIVDLETGISEVMSLKPRRFDWKEGEGSDTKNVAGFVAQEVETVLPDLVGDFKHDDLDDAKSVKMGDMIPTLVKAIQEQQAVIEDLKSRIDQMENK